MLNMATQRNINCDVCDNQSITTPASKWCSECDEAFCDQCLTFHTNTKSTRGHDTINVDDYKKLPPFVLKVKQHCEEHGAKYQKYCKSHDSLCCPVCVITNHKNCEDMLPVEDVIRNARSSTALFDIKQRLKNLNQFINLSCDEKLQNVEEITKQSQAVLQEIRNTRKSIDDHFDKLEQSIIKEASDVEVKVEKQIKETAKILQVQKAETGRLLEAIEQMEQHATDFQVFLGTKDLEREANGIEKDIRDLQAKDSFEKHEIIFEENSQISSILSNMHYLGKVRMANCPSEVKLKSPDVRQAQLRSANTSTFESLDLKLTEKIKCDKMTIFGSMIMSNGDILVSNFSSKSIDIWKDGSLTALQPTFIVELSGRPYDLTAIDDSTIAITVFSPCSIVIISLMTQTVTRTIETDGVVDGISYSDGKLIFSGEKSGLNMLNLENDKITKLHIGVKTSDTYISVHNEQIYCANSSESSVICYNKDLTEAFSYKTADLKDCRGITVDDDLNIYVACLVGHIVIISSDRTNHKSVSLNGIGRPRTLFLEKQGNSFLFVARKGQCICTLYLNNLKLINNILLRSCIFK